MMWTDHIDLQGVSIDTYIYPRNPILLSEYNWEAQAVTKNIAFSLQYLPGWNPMPRVGSYETFEKHLHHKTVDAKCKYTTWNT